MAIKKNHTEKLNLHARNKNRKRYDLKAMLEATPELKEYLIANKRGEESINFSNPSGVKMLNKAILNYYYGIKYWEFPEENLCPAIPGRADYIHHIADILAETNNGEIPIGKDLTCLDIGTGATCIYPIIGITEYQWNFIGTDINPQSIQIAKKIEDSNPSLKGKIVFRLQKKSKNIFQGVIEKGDKIDMSICNPPFHSSIEEAEKGTRRKIKNLGRKQKNALRRNFAGENHELIYEGGEHQFLKNMILESKEIAKNCLWFSSLVSKESNLKRLHKTLNKTKPSEFKTINIKTGNKTSRILTWTYLSKKERSLWAENKWKNNK